MKKFFSLIIYYFLIITGLFLTSWQIWSRFIRERVIREIPDPLLTEYRVWILLYICCIYLFVVKSLIKPANNVVSEIFSNINVYIWKPLITLDHAIKYNKYCKKYYYKVIRFIGGKWAYLSNFKQIIIILIFQVFPRIILVIALLIDTFYFHKLEMLYKFILIGILPFIFRYIQYSAKDYFEYMIKELTDKYEKVIIFEKGFRYNLSRIGKTDAVWHYDTVDIKQYIEVMYDTPIDCLIENTSYEYEGEPYCKQEIYQYYEKKFNKPIRKWNSEEDTEVRKLFDDLMPDILTFKTGLKFLGWLKERKVVLWSKIAIYCMYLICWSYILLVSYYHYPIELKMFKYLIMNFMQYLLMEVNIFNNQLFTVNENLITIENMKILIIKIKILLISMIFKIINYILT